MSAPSSPSSSPSSSDDFAALLDAELEQADDDEVWNSERGAQNAHWDDGQDCRKRPLEDAGASSSRKVQVTAEFGACPPHPGYIANLCIRCGRNKPDGDANSGTNGVALKYIHEKFELSEDEITRIRQRELEEVIGKKKLFLVLDLDHTLLNSARNIDLSDEERDYFESAYFDPELAPEGNTPMKLQECPEVAGPIYGGWGDLYKVCGLYMWTKLRPHVHKFLEEASQLFELYVYTMGEKTYALTMARLLDPTGRLFGGRVISQKDSTVRHSKDLDVVLGAENAVIILDDTEYVWPKHSANLLLMERYHFFTSSCKAFGREYPSLADAQMDESVTEGSLANILTVLKKIHAEFFSSQEDDAAALAKRDVREVIDRIRCKILAGCSVVFSHIIPKNASCPEDYPLWRLTESLGASCSLEVDEAVTHIISGDAGTEKAKWAKKCGRQLVHPAWVEAARVTWNRPNESDFPVRSSCSSSKCPVYSFAKTMDVSAVMKAQKRDHDQLDAAPQAATSS